MNERKRKHDDVHFPLQGKGLRARKRKYITPCQHRLISDTPNKQGKYKCFECGQEVSV